VIQRVAQEAVEDAAADNIKYMELRFTPKALSKLMSFPFDQVVDWVCQAVDAAQRTCDIKVRLIVSMNRHESVKEGERALQAALAHRDSGVVGLDLAGQEAGYSAAPFFPVFKQAKQAGLGITVHAGEWAGPGNIRDAIVHMGATRIGHGVRVVEDSTVTQLARERGTVFEVCPTSNIQSGSVVSKQHHPLRDMADLGLRTTINTDDPSVSNITLSDELLFSVQELGLSLDEAKQVILNGAKSAFLPEDERTALVSYFSEALAANNEV
jgi:adenosine deaminase